MSNEITTNKRNKLKLLISGIIIFLLLILLYFYLFFPIPNIRSRITKTIDSFFPGHGLYVVTSAIPISDNKWCVKYYPELVNVNGISYSHLVIGDGPFNALIPSTNEGKESYINKGCNNW
jgi:hypothetical protein